jgi:hypothetical protein
VSRADIVVSPRRQFHRADAIILISIADDREPDPSEEDIGQIRKQ